MNYEIGELAEKYETGRRGPGFISDGDKWDPGGDSYGSYQLATKPGTLQGYLMSKLPFTGQLNQYPMKSSQFDALWRRLAAEHPEEFKQSQFDYVKTISYDPCRKVADYLSILDTLAINSALFSISNQHGKWREILYAAGISKKDSEDMQVRRLYSARRDYVNSLSTLTAALKKNIVKQRCELERDDCLRLITDRSANDPPTSSTEVAQEVEKPATGLLGALQKVYQFLTK